MVLFVFTICYFCSVLNYEMSVILRLSVIVTYRNDDNHFDICGIFYVNFLVSIQYSNQIKANGLVTNKYISQVGTVAAQSTDTYISNTNAFGALLLIEASLSHLSFNEKQKKKK